MSPDAIRRPEDAQLRLRLHTGVAQMDRHHERLIEMFGAAGDVLRAGGEAAALAKIVGELIAYSIYHFDSEEALMKLHGYGAEFPEAMADHIYQHRIFAGKVVGFRDDLKAGRVVDRWNILDFLNSWLLNHIDTTDRRLAQFIRSRETAA